MKPRAIWQELPDHFKQDVVGFLDFRSRCQLKKCSKNDQELVSNCPFNIKKIEFRLKIDNEAIIRITDNGVTDKLIIQGHLEAVPIFIDFFEHPMSKFEILEIHRERLLEEAKAMVVFQNLLENFEKSKKSLKIQSLECIFFMVIPNFIQFIQKFDPQHFRKLKFTRETTEIHKLAETEQFKNLNSLFILGTVDAEIIAYTMELPIENFSVAVKKISEDKIWQFIQYFRRRKLPRLSNFTIYMVSHPPISLDNMMNLFDVPVHHESFQSQRLPHIQKFPTCSENLKLLVRFSEMSIVGVICHEDSVQADYETLNSGFPFFLV